MSRVSCIIPAYNEAPRIRKVLEAAVDHPLIGEIIVVDDGSTDSTSPVASTFPVTLITLPRNGGKSHALARGIEAAKGDLLLLLDADLVGLTKDDITALLTPVFVGEADVSISMRFNAEGFWRVIGINALLLRIGVDYLSGERVLPKALLEPHLKTIEKLPGFGIEVYINSLIIRERKKVVSVPWLHVSNPAKQSKHGIIKGARHDARMVFNIMQVVGPIGALKQIFDLRALTRR